MDIAAAFKDAGTSVIADVLDERGLRPGVFHDDVLPLRKGVAFAGPAATIAGASEDYSGGDRRKLAAIDALTPGSVAVWAGGDIRGVCCFGDLLATSMQARGVAGVVVDGGVRDAAFLSGMDLPILARYVSPAQGIGRWRVTSVDGPVRVRGAIDDWVTVTPGDWIVADVDGALVVPQALAADVAEQTADWAGREGEARSAIAAGMPLLEALDRFGHL